MTTPQEPIIEAAPNSTTSTASSTVCSTVGSTASSFIPPEEFLGLGDNDNHWTYERIFEKKNFLTLQWKLLLKLRTLQENQTQELTERLGRQQAAFEERLRRQQEAHAQELEEQLARQHLAFESSLAAFVGRQPAPNH